MDRLREEATKYFSNEKKETRTKSNKGRQMKKKGKRGTVIPGKPDYIFTTMSG